MLVSEKKKDHIARIGVIGTSGRGSSMFPLLTEMDDVIVPAVCDLYEDRAKEAAKKAGEDQGITVDAYTDYKEMFQRGDLDAVLITASWAAHGYLAVDAMNAGIYPAVECGGGSSIDECWQLVRTSQRTGVPCMALENCCYDKEEMAILRMIKEGVFGELIHCTGGYGHDLREEVSFGRENRHYRFDNYMHRNADLYPGHAIGPLSKFLNINRGNRMLTLTSMASKARGLNEYLLREKGEEYDVSRAQFCEGDIVTTMIKCAHGETILLTHDTTLPRYYSRFCGVSGTKGTWNHDGGLIFIDGRSPIDGWDHPPEKFEDYYKEFEHPLWKEFSKEGVKGGHGGMDWLVLRAFVESVINKTPPPMDVYDAATWMAITVLSEQSVSMGSMPVAIPDFTDSRWIHREPSVRSKYSLDEVCYDLFED